MGNDSRGRKIAKIPNSTKTIRMTNRAPPIPVKSYFVWKENRVKARHTTAVIPIAKRTASALNDNKIEVLKLLNYEYGNLCCYSVQYNEFTYLNALEKVPSKNPSAIVKIAKQMKFPGAFRRTPSQQANAIIVAKVRPNAA